MIYGAYTFLASYSTCQRLASNFYHEHGDQFDSHKNLWREHKSVVECGGRPNMP